MRPIAALYVCETGPYVTMPGVDAWTAARDAKLYAGPHPVVAHPPCGPWSRLSHLCHKQDRSCAPRAVVQVRAHGGVLEHPAYSKLFRALHLPWPDELPDEHGGRTYEVNQMAWGHVCAKRTWLYAVNVPPAIVFDGVREGGRATAVVASSLRVHERELRAATVDERIHSPIEFAEWLVSLARAAAPTPPIGADV